MAGNQPADRNGVDAAVAEDVEELREEKLLRSWRRHLRRRWNPPVRTALRLLKKLYLNFSGPYVCTACGAANNEWFPCCVSGEAIPLVRETGYISRNAIMTFGHDKVLAFLSSHLVEAIVQHLVKRANATKRLNCVLPQQNAVPTLRSIAQVAVDEKARRDQKGSKKVEDEDSDSYSSSEEDEEPELLDYEVQGDELNELTVMDESLVYLRKLSCRRRVRDTKFGEKRPLVSLLSMALGVFEEIISFADVGMIVGLERTSARLHSVVEKVSPAIWKRNGVEAFRSLGLVIPHLPADFTDFKGLYKRHYVESQRWMERDTQEEVQSWAATTSMVNLCNFIFIAEVHCTTEDDDDEDAGLKDTVYSFETKCIDTRNCVLVSDDFGPTVIRELFDPIGGDPQVNCIKLVCFHRTTGKSVALYRSQTMEDGTVDVDYYDTHDIPTRPSFHLFADTDTNPTDHEIRQYHQQQHESEVGIPQVYASIHYSEFQQQVEYATPTRGNLQFSFSVYYDGIDDQPMSMLALLYMLEHQVTFT